MKQSETSDDSYKVHQNNYIICTSHNNNSKQSGVDVPDLHMTCIGKLKTFLFTSSNFENSHPHILRLGPPLIEIKPYMRFMYTNILGESNESSRLDAINSLETEQLCNKV